MQTIRSSCNNWSTGLVANCFSNWLNAAEWRFKQSCPEANHTDVRTWCAALLASVSSQLVCGRANRLFGVKINTARVTQINTHVPAVKLASLLTYTPLNNRRCWWTSIWCDSNTKVHRWAHVFKCFSQKVQRVPDPESSVRRPREVHRYSE